jgi:hypothetical protein
MDRIDQLSTVQDTMVVLSLLDDNVTARMIEMIMCFLNTSE